VRPASENGLDGADLRSTQKEIAAVERRLKKVMQQRVELNAKMAAHDPADYPGLAALAERLPVLDAEAGELEDRWLDLTDRLG
jgi:septal ring factor EnvC (AmiA/AmiB activator)